MKARDIKTLILSTAVVIVTHGSAPAQNFGVVAVDQRSCPVQISSVSSDLHFALRTVRLQTSDKSVSKLILRTTISSAEREVTPATLLTVIPVFGDETVLEKEVNAEPTREISALSKRIGSALTVRVSVDEVTTAAGKKQSCKVPQ